MNGDEPDFEIFESALHTALQARELNQMQRYCESDSDTLRHSGLSKNLSLAEAPLSVHYFGFSSFLGIDSKCDMIKSLVKCFFQCKVEHPAFLF